MKVPDAIIVLSGGIKQDASGRWVSTDLTTEDDALGAPGGKLRVLAAIVLAARYPEMIVVASGGKGYDVLNEIPGDRPLCVEILRDELVASGMSASRIVLEQNSNSTYQQLQELEKLIAERSWQSVMIVTNRYHLPRVHAMIEAKFRALVGPTTLISAEETLIEADPARWTDKIAIECEKEYMQKRVQKEQSGIAQIRDGTYQFR